MKPEVYVKWYDFKLHSVEGAEVSSDNARKTCSAGGKRKRNSLVFLVTSHRSEHI